MARRRAPRPLGDRAPRPRPRPLGDRAPRPPPLGDRAQRPPPLGDRDLAAEVLYLHSLWRRGPPAPAPVPAPAAAPNQPRTAQRRSVKRKRRQLGPQDAGPEAPPVPPASGSVSPSPEKSTPAKEEAVPNCDPPRSARRKANKRKRRGLECDDAEIQDPCSEKPPAPSQPTAHKTWPDGPVSSPPSNPPPAPPSPGSLAHQEALRAAEEFFANQGSDDDDNEEVSESEGDEEAAAGFFTGLFERNAALRGRYEQSWEEGQFACMACAGKKVRRGKARRFRGCASLVQHARAATRYGRPGAHRALTAVVCRVLGWDIQRLPSIVLDPRGTLSQALAARAQSDAQDGKEDVGTEMNGSNTNGDEAANELHTSKESAGTKDVEEIASLNHEDSSRTNVYGHETNQEMDVVKTTMEEPGNIDGDKEITELSGGKESSEKDNANKDDSLSQDNSEVVHKQDMALESTEKENMEDGCSKDKCENEDCIKASVEEENMEDGCSKDKCENEDCIKASVEEEINATVSEPEHDETADGMGDTAVTRLGNGPKEEDVDENKEHASSMN